MFSPLKHYFYRAIERRLRTGASRFPKTEFLQTYTAIRPQALTEINIKSGFKKAGLIPFNPDKAIERLPTSPPPPSLPPSSAQPNCDP